MVPYFDFIRVVRGALFGGAFLCGLAGCQATQSLDSNPSINLAATEVRKSKPTDESTLDVWVKATFAEGAIRGCPDHLMIKTSFRPHHAVLLAAAYKTLGVGWVEQRISENQLFYRDEIGCSKAAIKIYSKPETEPMVQLTRHAYEAVSAAQAQSPLPNHAPGRRRSSADGIGI